jgi:cobalt-zinc-cadmium efflux system protein
MIAVRAAVRVVAAVRVEVSGSVRASATYPHGVAHDHAHRHGRGVLPAADRRWLGLALGLVVAFMAVEVAGAILAHSLALLSDAAHMVTDAGAIALALVAARLAARPPVTRPER